MSDGNITKCEIDILEFEKIDKHSSANMYLTSTSLFILKIMPNMQLNNPEYVAVGNIAGLVEEYISYPCMLDSSDIMSSYLRKVNENREFGSDECNDI